MELQKRNIPPCKDCCDRTVGCHPICQRYLEWKRKDELFKEEMRKCGRAESDIADYLRISRHKNIKRQRKK